MCCRPNIIKPAGASQCATAANDFLLGNIPLPFCSVSCPSALCCLPFPELALVAQLLHVPAKKLDFPLGSPLHAEAAHQEDVGMDIVFSIQHITLEEGKAHKDR